MEGYLRLLIYKRNRRGTLIKNLGCWSLRNTNYNHFPILRLFNVATNFPCTTSEIEARLLVLNMVYTSCLTSCRSTWDFGSKKIRNSKENLKTSWSYNLVPNPKSTLLILAKNCWKIEIKKFSSMSLFHMKPRVCIKYFLNYCSFSCWSIPAYYLLCDR